MAARFWVEQPISGAIVSPATPPLVRLTISSSTGMTTGDTVTVTSVVGTTEANGTWVITVIDGTHIDLQGTTFSNLYTSGGKINGRWNATYANNWVSSSGGTNYGQTVPGSSDAVTLDGSSGTGTVVITGADVTIQQMTCGAFNGVIDNSANRNMTFTANGGFNGSGTGTRTFTGGSGTYTLSSSGTTWNMLTTTGLTNPTTAFSSATITISGVSTGASIVFQTGGMTYGTVNFNANKGINIQNNTPTFTTLNITGPNQVKFQQGTTTTITNAFAWTGTSSAPIAITNTTTTTGIATITTGSATANTAAWTAFDRITFTPVGGSTLTATNSLDLGLNTGTGFTITAPSSGGGGGVIGS